MQVLCFIFQNQTHVVNLFTRDQTFDLWSGFKYPQWTASMLKVYFMTQSHPPLFSINWNCVPHRILGLKDYKILKDPLLRVYNSDAHNTNSSSVGSLTHVLLILKNCGSFFFFWPWGLFWIMLNLFMLCTSPESYMYIWNLTCRLYSCKIFFK